MTDKVVAEMESWRARPLDSVYPVVLIDALSIKIREGNVANRPIHVAVGIDCHGERDVLGLWVGTGGEGAKHWKTVLAELRNRGVVDVCIAPGKAVAANSGRARTCATPAHVRSVFARMSWNGLAEGSTKRERRLLKAVQMGRERQGATHWLTERQRW